MAQTQPVVGRPRPPEASDYLKFPTRAGIALFVGVLAVCVYAEFGLWYVLPFAAWGFFSAWFVVRQAQSFDRQVEYAMNPIVTIEREPEPPIVNAQLNVSPSQNHTRWGVHLPEKDWARLAGASLRKGGITRDMMLSIGVKEIGITGSNDMRSLTAPGRMKATIYDDFIHILVGQGLVSESKPRQPNKLTDAGIEAFRAIASPHPTGP